MYRKLASVILVASAINAKYVYALGLGEMTMHSALNEPLNAEIQLKNIGDLDSTQIIIKLAEDAQFNNAGIERTFFLSNMRFSVQIDAEGNGVVKLKSQKRVNEPFLDFLIEAKWPTGRVLRSYTALVDLPVYSEASASTVNMSDEQSQRAQGGETVIPGSSGATNMNVAPEEQPQKAEIVSSDSDSDTEQASPAPSQSKEVDITPVASQSNYAYYQEPVSASEYGTKRGDTLWEIAANHKPASDLTVQQVMIAIQRENPEAFIGGNINRLKAGMILSMPTAQQVYDITQSAATSEVGRQNQDITYAPQIDATESSSVTDVASLSEDQGHLSLSASGSGSGNGSVEEGSLNASQEEALSSENTSLNKQVDSLSTQVNQLERLLEIKEQQLAELQNNLSASNIAEESVIEVEAGDIVEITDAIEVTAVGEETELVSEDVVDVVIEEIIVAETADGTVIEEVIVEKVVVETVEEEPIASKSLLDTLLETPMYLGGIALLIMGLVAGLFIRKRNQSEQAALDAFEDFEFEDETLEQEVSVDDEVPENTIEETVDEIVVDEVVEEVVEETTAQTGDAIGEADIYIAYGRFDQASELLKNALAESPTDVALRSKLLEVYAQSSNQAGFVSEYNQLEAQGETEAVNAAKDLLSSVDGGASWLSADKVLEQVDEIDDLDLDLDTALDDSFVDSESIETDTLESKDLLDDLDLDLSSDVDTELEVDVDLDSSHELDELDLDLGADLDADIEAEIELDSSSALDDLDLDLTGSSSDNTYGLDTDLGTEDGLAEATVVEEVLGTLDDAADDLNLDLDTASLDASDDASLGDLDLSVEDDAGLGEALDLSDSLDLDVSGSTDEESDLEGSLSQGVMEDEVLDLGDVDLGLELSDDETVDEVEDSLGLSLGDEIDLSADVPVETVEKVAEEAIVEAPAVDSAEINSLDDDLSFLTGEDEISTKLDLAKAYIEMGDADGAKDILAEVLEEGNEAQKSEAETMLTEIS